MTDSSNTRRSGAVSLISESVSGAENIAPQGVEFGLQTPVLQGMRKGVNDLDKTGGRGLSARARKGSFGPGGPSSPISRKTPGNRGLHAGNTGGRTGRRALGDITNRKASNGSSSVLKSRLSSIGNVSTKSTIPFPLNFDVDGNVQSNGTDTKHVPKLERRLQLTPIKCQPSFKQKTKAKSRLPPIPRKPNGDVESPELIPISCAPHLPEPPVLDLGPDLSAEVVRKPPLGRQTSNLFLFKNGTNSDDDDEDIDNFSKKKIEKPCEIDLDSDNDDIDVFSKVGVPFSKGLNAKLTAPVSYDKLFTKDQDGLPELRFSDSCIEITD